MQLKMMVGEEEAQAAHDKLAARERAKAIAALEKIGNPFQEFWRLECRGVTTLLKASSKAELVDALGEVTRVAPHGNGAILAVRNKGVYVVESFSRKGFLRMLVKIGKEAV